MINTIEVAPAILAASLAKKLSEDFLEFITLDDPYVSATVDQHKLRVYIRDFLTEKPLEPKRQG